MQIRVFVPPKFNKTNVRQAVANLLGLVLLITFGLVLPRSTSAAQSAPEPVHVGGDVKPPIKVKDVKPVYPDIARQTRTQGVVVVELTVGVTGKVDSAKVVKSLPMLDNAALEAVKKWEYKPTVIDGKATPVIMTTAVIFKLF
ncbi:MAG: energy transducer TonB [Bryobacteraceae bacterium]